MEIRCGGLWFTSKFDSGNLAQVEKVVKDDEDNIKPAFSGPDQRPDYEYNVWTKPDCGGTVYENGNRSWFYFGVRGGGVGRLIKINFMNLNRQGKLFSQGHSPFVKTVPGNNRWERVRDRPTFETVDGQFLLSFTHRFTEGKGAITYFAFCYPWSYTECQEQLAALDKKFEHCKNLTSESPPDELYYHRELLCHSLDNNRIDLITVSDCRGIQGEEARFDSKLFPDTSTPRCKDFKDKRVYLVSSRVHPGETPGSFVFNGFLEFILRTDDPRAIQLRKHYVFKLIPILNPDGVIRGHYRTDSRGVNLNRMYSSTDFDLYPSIYASQSVLVYHHIHNKVATSGKDAHNLKCSHSQLCAKDVDKDKYGKEDSHNTLAKDVGQASKNVCLTSDLVVIDGCDLSILSLDDPAISGGDEGRQSGNSVPGDGHVGNEASDDDIPVTAPEVKTSNSPIEAHMEENKKLSIPPSQSGIAFYVDLHGHASKRGCFIYGNYFENEDVQIENMLFPKLISMNTAHFDFGGCNFTQRNMYTKDKRDGLSKEGSGRVGIYKKTGIIHSYTLECNYNAGRMVNSVPPAYGDNGRATPPPLAGFPPKYTIAHFEEVGKAMAIAALDMLDTNPWSRIILSEHSSIHGVRDWVRRHIRGLRGLPRGPSTRMTKTAIKATSMSNGSYGSTAFIPRVALLAQQKNADDGQSVASTVQNNHPRVNISRRASQHGKKELLPVRDVGHLDKSKLYDGGGMAENRAKFSRNASRTEMTRGKMNSQHTGLKEVIPSTMVTSVTSNSPCVTMQHSLSSPTVLASTASSDLKQVIVPKLRQPRPCLHDVTVASVSPSHPAVRTHSPPSTALLAGMRGVPTTSPRAASFHMAHTRLMIRQQMTTTPEVLPIQQHASNYSIEEHKLQQLKNFTGLRHKPPSHLATASHPLETPKSDPPKRRMKKPVSKRRSSSHSPKSGKLVRRHASSSTDSDAEKKPRSQRRRSMPSKLKAVAASTLEETPQVTDFDIAPVEVMNFAKTTSRVKPNNNKAVMSCQPTPSLSTLPFSTFKAHQLLTQSQEEVADETLQQCGQCDTDAADDDNSAMFWVNF